MTNPPSKPSRAKQIEEAATHHGFKFREEGHEKTAKKMGPAAVFSTGFHVGAEWADKAADRRVTEAVKAERERIIERLKEYREAYPEDLFTPIAPGEKNDGTDRFTTRVSGHMARFILDNLISGNLTLKDGE